MSSKEERGRGIEEERIENEEEGREIEDEVSGQCFGKVTPLEEDRKSDVTMWIESASKHSSLYAMNHKRRGKCLVFYYSKYKSTLNLLPRKMATVDKENVERCFSKLGFKVDTHHNLSKDDLLDVIDKASNEDHSDCDCFSLVFMSHGKSDEYKKENLFTFDDVIEVEDLWGKFSNSNCKSLKGKPKLFFFQACRGKEVDKGVQMSSLEVETDALQFGQITRDYVIPSKADMLFMWASFPGHYCFVTKRTGIVGSVFIFFLCQELDKIGSRSLSSVLLSITRKVALEFESYNPENPRLDSTEQVPCKESTLLREIYFP